MTGAVGFAGLDAGGVGLALRAAAHRPVRFVADDETDAAALTAAGATPVTTVDELAATCEVLVLGPPLLAGPRDLVDDAVMGSWRDIVVLDRSRCTPRSAVEAAAILAGRGVTLVDVALPGHLDHRGDDGELPVVVSGADAAGTTTAHKTLGLPGVRVIPAGGAGAARALDLLVTGLGVSTYLATLEVISMGLKFGLGTEVMADVVNKGSGRNTTSRTVLPALVAGEPVRTRSVGETRRAVDRFLGVAAESCVPTPAIAVAGSALRAAEQRLGAHAALDEIVAVRADSADADTRPQGSPAPEQRPASVGFIGLGAMGAALAERLLLTRPVTVFDVRPDAVGALERAGATVAASAADLARDSDVVMICVPTSQIVRSVLFGPDGIADSLRPGAVVIDHTTGDPAETVDLGARLAERGTALVDAPVSGGTRGAKAGTLAVICGGPEDEFARLRPVLAAISPNIVHCGRTGAGHAAKLVQNAIAACNRYLTLEAIAVACRAGADLGTIREAVVAGDAWNGGAERILDALPHDRPTTDFQIGLMVKDLRLAVQLGLGTGVPMPLTGLVQAQFQACVDEHGYTANLDVIARSVESSAGLRFRDYSTRPSPEPGQDRNDS
ncbi:NAD(P)-binding domain-containing protein [Saccharomonospora sp. NPDC046836]|uniref:NAD(P)-binding domain-containing protein n=1 Tax=Saccharomonospora sp. NPDC046836 TaxID=3156921 RepID=UPI003407FE3B